jgi:hypothetical protein
MNFNNRRVFYWFLLVSIFSVQTSTAQSAADSVQQVVASMFRAMNQSDTLTLKSLFTESAQLQTVAVLKDGTTGIRTEPVSNFITMVGRMPAGDADERIHFEGIHIDGNLASVWTPYQFYFKGTFRHCGVNSFQLIRSNGLWKIHYLIDTRRKEGCH